MPPLEPPQPPPPPPAPPPPSPPPLPPPCPPLDEQMPMSCVAPIPVATVASAIEWPAACALPHPRPPKKAAAASSIAASTHPHDTPSEHSTRAIQAWYAIFMTFRIFPYSTIEGPNPPLMRPTVLPVFRSTAHQPNWVPTARE